MGAKRLDIGPNHLYRGNRQGKEKTSPGKKVNRQEKGGEKMKGGI